jgi:translation initiation factor 6 (eIF-6)
LFNIKDSTVVLRSKSWNKLLSSLERINQVKKWKKNLSDNDIMVQEISEEMAVLGNIVFTNWHGGTNLLVEYA